MSTKDYYIIHFAIAHHNFRIPELLAVAECLGCEIELPADEEEMETDRPFMVVKLHNDEDARRLLTRCILIKAIYALWGRGKTYDDVHTMNKAHPERWAPFQKSSFKFTVAAINQTMRQSRIQGIIDSFDYINFSGPVDLKSPEVSLMCWEEYRRPHPTTFDRYQEDGNFREVLIGRLVGEGSARPLLHKFDVKKRIFYGNTSMDAQMSLIMANQAQASPGKMIYDPFAGTGSMLYTAAHFGAFVVGSDMDGRQMRGKETVPGVARAAAQYELSSRFVGCLTFDITKNPWRCGNLFDAIVTDPPYGVRAGAKRQGGKSTRAALRETPITLPDGVIAHTKATYVPPMRPYELSDLAQDLVELSRYLLKPGGRLVYFLPTVNEEYQDVDIPMCEGMTLVANSLQDFGKWGRRLITVVKTTHEAVPPPSFSFDHDQTAGDAENTDNEGSSEAGPAHRDFRLKYFNRFKPI